MLPSGRCPSSFTYAVDPRARVVEMLPGATGKPRLVESVLLLVEDRLVFDQEVRHLPVRNLDAHTPQQLGHLCLAHLGPEVEHQRQPLDPRTKLAAVAWRQGRQGGLVLRR